MKYQIIQHENLIRILLKEKNKIVFDNENLI